MGSLFSIFVFHKREKEYFCQSHRKKAHGGSCIFNDSAYQKAAEGGAAEENKGVKAHDASQVFRRSGKLNGRIAVDHKKNHKKTKSGEKNEGWNVECGMTDDGKEQTAGDGKTIEP